MFSPDLYSKPFPDRNIEISEKFKMNFLKKDNIGSEVLLPCTTTEKGFNIPDLGALSMRVCVLFKKFRLSYFKSLKCVDLNLIGVLVQEDCFVVFSHDLNSKLVPDCNIEISEMIKLDFI